MPRGSRDIAVIGLGSFGASVARELARFGDHVLGIDEDEARVADLSDALPRTLIADARDERAMAEAGLAEYDVAVVAMASRLECSLLAVMAARSLGVEEIWAKAANPTHARILERIGATRILQPEQQFGEHIAHMLHNPAIGDYVRIGEELHVASVRLPSRLAGRSVTELELQKRYRLRMVGLVRGGVWHDCDPDLALAEGDMVLLLGARPEIRGFADRI